MPGFRRTLTSLVMLLLAGAAAFAAGPVETNPYAVQGVAVDETGTSAAAAKDKAIIDAQMKAFPQLGERLGSAEVAAEMAKFDQKQVIPLLKSLSIEEEEISPGRYQAKFTIRFIPERVKPILQSLGVQLPAEQGPALMVVPVWQDETGAAFLFEDNPWRAAWMGLDAQQAQIPLIVPLGDPQDAETLTAQDAINGNAVKLEALRRRYDVKTILVAIAQPAPGGGIHAHVVGNSPLGKIVIDKIYKSDTATVHDSTILAAQRFHQLMEEKFRSDQAKIAAKSASSGFQAVAVNIPFGGPSEWNGLRARILSAPGVVGIDVTSLGGQGAAANLRYSGPLDELQQSFQSAGLQFSHSGANWVISPI
ncbi:MAG: DUF2066 domain-containing protein [Aestuariivirga sp.]